MVGSEPRSAPTLTSADRQQSYRSGRSQLWLLNGICLTEHHVQALIWRASANCAPGPLLVQSGSTWRPVSSREPARQPSPPRSAGRACGVPGTGLEHAGLLQAERSRRLADAAAADPNQAADVFERLRGLRESLTRVLWCRL